MFYVKWRFGMKREVQNQIITSALLMSPKQLNGLL